MQKTIVAVAIIALTCFAAVIAESADNCASVLKSMNAEVAQKGYRIRTTDVNPDGGAVTSSSTTEVQPPDRMHLINPGDEMIVIRGRGTFRKAKGRWEKAPYDLSDAMLSAYDPQNFRKFSGGCKSVGKEKLNGKAMSIWQYASSGLGVNSTARIWISDSDGLPYKLEVDGNAAGHKTRTIQLIEYDKKINVQPPIQ